MTLPEVLRFPNENPMHIASINPPKKEDIVYNIVDNILFFWYSVSGDRYTTRRSFLDNLFGMATLTLITSSCLVFVQKIHYHDKGICALDILRKEDLIWNSYTTEPG